MIQISPNGEERLLFMDNINVEDMDSRPSTHAARHTVALAGSSSTRDSGNSQLMPQLRSAAQGCTANAWLMLKMWCGW